MEVLIIDLKNIPYNVFKYSKSERVDEVEFGNTKFRIKDKEKAKNRSKQIIENYFNIFVK